MELRYRLLNVFTRDGRPLTGNPLCVFEDGTSLDDAAMQALARQFNLSETTFLMPSARASAHVRIFTPSYELPFAGHPTLGSAEVCRALGLGGDALTLEMRAGVIPVSAQGRRWMLAANPARSREIECSRARLAEQLGLTEQDIGERPLWVSTGTEQLIVPLTSTAAVERAIPASAGFPGMAYVFAMAAPDRVLARFFFPQGAAILEDPATGSACANLGGWWIAMNREIPCNLMISQGEKIERPSTLELAVEAGGQIRVSGEVIEIGRGTLRY